MPSGILGKINLNTANTSNVVYVVPNSKTASFTINMVNRNSDLDTLAKIALAATDTPDDSEYIEFNASIPPYGVLERTGLVAGANANVVVTVSQANVTVTVYGYEE